MKAGTIISGMITVIFLFSFQPSESTVDGIYGVCSDSGTVELQLNPDGTYHYMDRSDSKALVDVQGTWVANNKKIYLKNNDHLQFHRKWHISSDGNVAKSRKGMAFYRLVKKSNCQ